MVIMVGKHSAKGGGNTLSCSLHDERIWRQSVEGGGFISNVVDSTIVQHGQGACEGTRKEEEITTAPHARKEREGRISPR